MKKATIFSALFLAVFGLTLGITLMTYQPAAAYQVCEYACLYEYYCSTDTGSQCPGMLPNYLYRKSLCSGGPLNCPYIPNWEWAGCCPSDQ